MMMKLPEDLRQAVEPAGGGPIHLVDPAASGHDVLVLMRADQYEKVRAVFEGEEHDFDPREAYPLVDKVMREDDANDLMSRVDDCLKAVLGPP